MLWILEVGVLLLNEVTRNQGFVQYDHGWVGNLVLCCIPTYVGENQCIAISFFFSGEPVLVVEEKMSFIHSFIYSFGFFAFDLA